MQNSKVKIAIQKLKWLLAATSIATFSFLAVTNAQQPLTVGLVNDPENGIANGVKKLDGSYEIWLEWQLPSGVKKYEVLENNRVVREAPFGTASTEVRLQRAYLQSVSSGSHQYVVKLYNERNELIAQGNAPSVTVAGEGVGTTSGTIKYTSPDLSPLFESREYETLGDYLGDLIKVALVLSVVAATLVVVYAGFDYLNSGGSPEATARAKEMIAGALFGLATVFLAGVFLVSLYSPEALAPPAEQATGQAGGSKQALANKLNAKFEQLKTAVPLTLAQEQKLKSAIEKAANEGKPDAAKQAIRQVADEIAKQKPQLKTVIDQQIDNTLKEVDKIFTESAPAQGTGSGTQDSKQKTGDPTARTPSKRVSQLDEQYLDDVTQFLAAAITEVPCSLSYGPSEPTRLLIVKPAYASRHCSPPQPKFKSLLEAAQRLAAHAQKNEKAYEEIQKSVTSSGYKACNLFILTATALTVDSGVSGKDLGSLDKCPKANQFDEYFSQRGYQTIPLETYRNNVRGIKPGDILQREVAGTGHVVVVEKVVVEGKQRKIQTIEASLGQLHPRRRIETFEFYLDERKFDNVIRKP